MCDLSKFNDQQLEAINFYKGACGVVASAGSGKSTVLIERISNLVNNHDESQSSILAISFTSKTASELKSKLEKMRLDKVNVGTFHAICMRIMIKEGIDVRGKLVPEWKVENWFKDIDKKPNTREILGFIGYQKNYMKTPTDEFMYKDSEYTEEELRAFYRIYESRKKEEGYYDFDDYLIICLDLLQKNKGKYAFDFVLVDEHQDSNLVQNMILQELCQTGNIFAVFDAKQAIYGFRAGNVEYCLNFDKYWNNPTIINMFVNYRSTNNVVENSNNFIRPYFRDYKHYKDSKANNVNNGEITLRTYKDDVAEALGVVDKIEQLIAEKGKPEEIAVLYRLNSQSIHIENELKRREIEYDITNDSSFFKRKEIDAIVNYLRIIHSPHDDGALENIFKFRAYPLKFFSNNNFDKIRHHSGINNLSLFESLINVNYEKPWQLKSANEFERSISRLILQKEKGVSVSTLIDNIVKSFDIINYINERYNSQEEIAERTRSIDILKSFVKNNNLEQFITYIYSSNTKKKAKKNAVKLMTSHSSKGLEWDDVFLVGIEDSVFPHEKSSVDEEARLFYVATTRSKVNLYISQIGEGNKFIKEYFGN